MDADEHQALDSAHPGALNDEEKRRLLDSLQQQAMEGLATALLEQARQKLQVAVDNCNQGKYVQGRQVCIDCSNFISKEVASHLAEFPEHNKEMSNLMAKAKNIAQRAKDELLSRPEGQPPRVKFPAVEPIFVTTSYGRSELGPSRISGFPNQLTQYYDNPESIGGAVGGYASVFKALSKQSAQTVAIKVYHQHSLTQELEKDIEREAKVWLGLKHRNIVKLNYMHYIPYPYLEMDFISGGNLAQYLQGRAPLPVDEAALIVLKLAEGLGYAHGLDPPHYHGDIKPENILLTEASPLGEPKLSDWGLGRLMDEISSFAPSDPHRFTRRYATPEHFLLKSGQGKLGLETDIYQLALVFYEMITGVVPFDTGTLEDREKLVLNQKPQSVAALNNEAKPLDGLIQRCLLKSRQDRPTLLEVRQQTAQFLGVQCEIIVKNASTTGNRRKLFNAYAIIVQNCAIQNDPQRCQDYLRYLSKELPSDASDVRGKVHRLTGMVEHYNTHKLFTDHREEIIPELESLARDVAQI